MPVTTYEINFSVTLSLCGNNSLTVNVPANASNFTHTGYFIKIIDASGVVLHFTNYTGMSPDIPYAGGEYKILLPSIPNYGNYLVEVWAIPIGKLIGIKAAAKAVVCQEMITLKTNGKVEVITDVDCESDIVRISDRGTPALLGAKGNTSYNVMVTVPGVDGTMATTRIGTLLPMIITDNVTGSYTYQITKKIIYNFGDYVVEYCFSSSGSFNVACNNDLCAIAYYAIDKYKKVFSDQCSSGTRAQEEKDLNRISTLLVLANQLIKCGASLKPIYQELEKIDTTSCACTPVSGQLIKKISSTGTVIVEPGCGDITVISEISGSTTKYTINNKVISIVGDDYITIEESEVNSSSCIRKFTATLDIAKVALEICEAIQIEPLNNCGDSCCNGVIGFEMTSPTIDSEENTIEILFEDTSTFIDEDVSQSFLEWKYTHLSNWLPYSGPIILELPAAGKEISIDVRLCKTVCGCGDICCHKRYTIPGPTPDCAEVSIEITATDPIDVIPNNNCDITFNPYFTCDAQGRAFLQLGLTGPGVVTFADNSPAYQGQQLTNNTSYTLVATSSNCTITKTITTSCGTNKQPFPITLSWACVGDDIILLVNTPVNVPYTITDQSANVYQANSLLNPNTTYLFTVTPSSSLYSVVTKTITTGVCPPVNSCTPISVVNGNYLCSNGQAVLAITISGGSGDYKILNQANNLELHNGDILTQNTTYNLYITDNQGVGCPENYSFSVGDCTTQNPEPEGCDGYTLTGQAVTPTLISIDVLGLPSNVTIDNQVPCNQPNNVNLGIITYGFLKNAGPGAIQFGYKESDSLLIQLSTFTFNNGHANINIPMQTLGVLVYDQCACPDYNHNIGYAVPGGSFFEQCLNLSCNYPMCYLKLPVSPYNISCNDEIFMTALTDVEFILQLLPNTVTVVIDYYTFNAPNKLIVSTIGSAQNPSAIIGETPWLSEYTPSEYATDPCSPSVSGIPNPNLDPIFGWEARGFVQTTGIFDGTPATSILLPNAPSDHYYNTLYPGSQNDKNKGRLILNGLIGQNGLSIVIPQETTDATYIRFHVKCIVEVVPDPILTVNCLSDITIQESSYNQGALVNWTPPTASTTCPGGVVTITQSAGPNPNTVVPVGTYVIEHLITDNCGNEQTCSFTLTVTPAPNLTASCPGDITIQESSPGGGALVSWTPPTASTTCPIGTVTVTQTSGPTNNTVLAVGIYTVVYSISDQCGNQATCSFTIEVTPMAAPLCEAIVSVDSQCLSANMNHIESSVAVIVIGSTLYLRYTNLGTEAVTLLEFNEGAGFVAQSIGAGIAPGNYFDIELTPTSTFAVLEVRATSTSGLLAKFLILTDMISSTRYETIYVDVVSGYELNNSVSCCEDMIATLVFINDTISGSLTNAQILNIKVYNTGANVVDLPTSGSPDVNTPYSFANCLGELSTTRSYGVISRVSTDGPGEYYPEKTIEYQVVSKNILLTPNVSNLGGDSITSYNWTIISGNYTGTAANGNTFTITGLGAYTVQLEVQTAEGCTYTVNEVFNLPPI